MLPEFCPFLLAHSVCTHPDIQHTTGYVTSRSNAFLTLRYVVAVVVVIIIIIIIFIIITCSDLRVRQINPSFYFVGDLSLFL
jgi:Na+/H+-translocating membrane pyrophosphatase